MFATVCHKRERSRFEDTNDHDTCMMDDETSSDENQHVGSGGGGGGGGGGGDFHKRSRSNAWGQPNTMSTSNTTMTSSVTTSHHLYPFSSSTHPTFPSQALPPLHHSLSSDQEPLAAMQYVITQQQHTRKFSFDTSSPSPSSPNHLMTSPSNGTLAQTTPPLCTSTPSPTHAPPCSPNLISDRMISSPSPSSSSTRMSAPPPSPLSGKMTPHRSIPRRHLSSTDVIPNDSFAQHETGWAMVNRKLHLSPVHHTTSIMTNIPTSISTSTSTSISPSTSSNEDHHVRRHVQATMRRMLLSTNPPVSNITRM